MTEAEAKEDIKQAEARDRLVIEYIDLCMQFTDAQRGYTRHGDIKLRLNEIRRLLGIEEI